MSVPAPALSVRWFARPLILAVAVLVTLFAAAGLDLVAQYAPLGRADGPIGWVSEKEIAPWVIYVLKKKTKG